jgi:SpoVK/Ycf46/Vps4 family AAA+-type ATPase
VSQAKLDEENMTPA